MSTSKNRSPTTLAIWTGPRQRVVEVLQKTVSIQLQLPIKIMGAITPSGEAHSMTEYPSDSGSIGCATATRNLSSPYSLDPYQADLAASTGDTAPVDSSCCYPKVFCFRRMKILNKGRNPCSLVYCWNPGALCTLEKAGRLASHSMLISQLGRIM